jgi:2-dehydro-3-deoxyphosphogluconate aldolase/(4S)-4-hydroxy-2-oxoglutarate aldolase
VVSAEQVRACAAVGARFVVSPGVVPEVIREARELGLEPVPGVFTATEILTATAAGARVMKLFPASCGGPSYLRALRGPFPATQLVPTGGVRLEEIGAYFEAGATVVALGSQLVGRSAPRTDTELEWIAAQAARAAEAARNAALPAAAAG